MAQVLVRDIDEQVVQRLKARAERSGRSLQVELKMILEQAARSDIEMARFKRLAAKIRRELAGHRHSDSGALQAEDRER